MGVSGGFFEGEQSVGMGIAIALREQFYLNTATVFSGGVKGGRVGFNFEF